MAPLVLVATAIVGSVAAGFFVSVSMKLRAQPVSPDAKTAIGLFSMWWLALGLIAIVGAAQDLLAFFDVAPLEAFLALTYMQVFALCIGLWGLMYYLAYVLTGKRTLLAPLALLFAAYYGAIVFTLTIGRPMAVEFFQGQARLMYETPLVDNVALALLLVTPPLLASLTYFALSLTTRSAPHRYRATIVAFATVAWSAGMLAREAALLEVLPALLAFAAAWAVSWAYAPPAFVKKRLHAE